MKPCNVMVEATATGTMDVAAITPAASMQSEREPMASGISGGRGVQNPQAAAAAV